MTITCDAAFDALTDPRATDPRGTGQPELEQHLASCARCRQMRDVLAPALALFAGEAPLERPGLSASRAEEGLSTRPSPPNALLSTAAVHAAGEAARKLSSRHRRRPWRTTSLPELLRTAAVFLLGIATAFAIVTVGNDRPVATPAAAPPPGACLWTSAGQSQPEQARAEQVILSCVACHLPASDQ